MVSPMTGISEQISESLLNDPRTRGDVIEVSARQGVVTLTGKVKSDAVRQAAEEIARKHPSVITVVNEIKV